MCRRYFFVCPVANRGLCHNNRGEEISVPGLPDYLDKIPAYEDRCDVNIASGSRDPCPIGPLGTQNLAAVTDAATGEYPHCDHCEFERGIAGHISSGGGAREMRQIREQIVQVLEGSFRQWALQQEQARFYRTPPNSNATSSHSSQVSNVQPAHPQPTQPLPTHPPQTHPPQTHPQQT